MRCFFCKVFRFVLRFRHVFDQKLSTFSIAKFCEKKLHELMLVTIPFLTRDVWLGLERCNHQSQDNITYFWISLLRTCESVANPKVDENIWITSGQENATKRRKNSSKHSRSESAENFQGYWDALNWSRWKGVNYQFPTFHTYDTRQYCCKHGK